MANSYGFVWADSYAKVCDGFVRAGLQAVVHLLRKNNPLKVCGGFGGCGFGRIAGGFGKGAVAPFHNSLLRHDDFKVGG